jgi:lipoprotein-anchoring transpeptidase ErfK/SrfK
VSGSFSDIGKVAMRRRIFLALAVTSCVAFSLKPSVAAGENSTLASLPVSPDEPFPISEEDYQLVKPQFRPRVVEFPTRESPGTIIINTRNRYLYLVLGDGKAKRYGVGVGRRGFQWSGTAQIGRKAKWPVWIPPQEMMVRDREAAKWPDGMPGGLGNPLGARALYLYKDGVDTLYRIHGTREPTTIGRAVSSGCVRMLNADVADLFDRAPVGTKVIVLGPTPMPFKGDWAKVFGRQPEVYWNQVKRDFRKLLKSWDGY